MSRNDATANGEMRFHRFVKDTTTWSSAGLLMGTRASREVVARPTDANIASHFGEHSLVVDDHAADVMTGQQIRVTLIDLVEGVAPRDEPVQLEFPALGEVQ